MFSKLYRQIQSFDPPLVCCLKLRSVWKSVVKSLPNGKILDWSKLEAFADDKINVTEMMISVSDGVDNITGFGKHCGKRRKCWLPAFSPFPTVFF